MALSLGDVARDERGSGAGRGAGSIVALRRQRRSDAVGWALEVEGAAVQWATRHTTNAVAVSSGVPGPLLREGDSVDRTP
jgi:hypothetical protein